MLESIVKDDIMVMRRRISKDIWKLLKKPNGNTNTKIIKYWNLLDEIESRLYRIEKKMNKLLNRPIEMIWTEIEWEEKIENKIIRSQ